MSESKEETIKGRIIGYGPGVIYVETPELDIYTLDRFAAIRTTDDGLTLFSVPSNFHHG